MDSYTPGEKAVPWQQADGPFSGKQLEGIAYRQLIPWVNPGEGAFRVVTGDFVTTEEGTGIVHIAPTFGDDDNKVAKKHNIPALLMTDSNGNLCPMVDKTGKFYRLEDLDPDFVGSRVDAQTY
ncbi:class I tRNA ligase family protein, partial [Escherichia coli]